MEKDGPLLLGGGGGGMWSIDVGGGILVNNVGEMMLEG